MIWGRNPISSFSVLITNSPDSIYQKADVYPPISSANFIINEVFSRLLAYTHTPVKFLIVLCYPNLLYFGDFLGGEVCLIHQLLKEVCWIFSTIERNSKYFCFTCCESTLLSAYKFKIVIFSSKAEHFITT